MLDFTLLNKTYQLSLAEILLLQNNPDLTRNDWSLKRYENYKQNVKANLVLGQFNRCAYCRKLLEADGKYEPLDHIIPQSRKSGWIFKVKNLILTCDSCNNLKSKEQTLTEEFETSQDLPEQSDAYKIFNPHFDRWSDHLTFEDDIFIVGIANSKGKETIRICKLFRYNVILNRAKELKIGHKLPAEKIIHRMTNLNTTDPEYLEIKQEFMSAVTHFLKRMEDNINFE